MPAGLFCFSTEFFVIFFRPCYKLYLYRIQPEEDFTMAYNNQPKPDDRSDNAEKIQSMIQDTTENIQKAEESMQFTDSEQQRQQIEAKNQRRRESIESFQAELQDET